MHARLPRCVDERPGQAYAGGVIRVATAVGVAVALIVAVGCGSETEAKSTTDDEPAAAYGDGSYGDEAAGDEGAEDEWDSREGDAWEEFNDGYLSGWESGCYVAFDGSPDGSLYDQGDEYTADDCYDLAPFDASDADMPIDIPLDPYSEGEVLGETDGCYAAFEELPTYGVLNWGEDSFDDSVCP
jgi:hypothetical protein